MEQDQSVLDFREVLWKARRSKCLALLPIVLLLCLACVYLMITPPLYESAVVVSVDDNAPVSRELGSIVNNRTRSEESRLQRVQRVDVKIHSRPFLDAIANRTGSSKNPRLLALASEAARQWRGLTGAGVPKREGGAPEREKIRGAPGRDDTTRD